MILLLIILKFRKSIDYTTTAAKRKQQKIELIIYQCVFLVVKFLKKNKNENKK